MPRPKKLSLDYLKISLVATIFADEVGIARTGYAIARWLERLHGWEVGACDAKPWRRFLKGHEPRAETFGIILAASPDATAVFHHILWKLLRHVFRGTELSDTLEYYGYRKGMPAHAWLAHYKKLESLDRLAAALAMYAYGPISEGISLQEIKTAYAQVVVEHRCFEIQAGLLDLLQLAIEKLGKTDHCLLYCEAHSAIELWSAIYFFYQQVERQQNQATWFSWRESVERLDWQERKALIEFLHAKTTTGVSDNLGKSAFRKIKRRVYRTKT